MGLTSRFSVTGIRVRSSSDTVRIRYRAIVSHTVRVRPLGSVGLVLGLGLVLAS